MSNLLLFQGKPLELLLSRSAAVALRSLSQPLFVRMELQFSCLVKKNLIFHDQAPLDLPCEEVAPGLHLGFQALMNRTCGVGKEVQLIEYPVTRFRKVQPRWLQLDHRHDAFAGTFGFRLAEAPRPRSFTGMLQRHLPPPRA